MLTFSLILLIEELLSIGTEEENAHTLILVPVPNVSSIRYRITLAEAANGVQLVFLGLGSN